MAISLKQFNGSLVTPKDDASLYHSLGAINAGVIHGIELTIQNLNYVHITGGYGVICGREFYIDEADVAVDLPDAAGKGQIYIHMDLSDSTTPIQLVTEAVIESGSLTTLTQNVDCNYENGVYDLLLATYTCTATSISTLTPKYTKFGLTGNVLDTVEEIDANTMSGRIAGALAVKEINSNLEELDGRAVSGFADETYAAVTGLAYDAASKNLD